MAADKNNIRKTVMSNKGTENVSAALTRFFKELPEAPFWAKVPIILAVASFGIAGHYLAKSLSVMLNQTTLSIGMWISLEIITTWLIAFVCGVRARPVPYVREFPPVRLMHQVAISAASLVVVASICLGIMSKTSVLRSLAYAAIGWFAIIFIRGSWFALSALRTQSAIRILPSRKEQIIDADTFRGMWSFSWIALLAMHLILLGLGGNLVILNASLVTAVFATGYASGYIP